MAEKYGGESKMHGKNGETCMSGFWEKRAHNALGATMAGMASFGVGFLLADLKAAAASAGSERHAAALVMAVTLSLFLAGFPAGWAAGNRSEETPLPMWLSMAGAWLAPVAAWFAGLEPEWPLCWPVAFALASAGGWAGLGVGLLLARKVGGKGC